MRLTLLFVFVALAVELCVSFKISGTDLSKDRLRRESGDGTDESAGTSDGDTPSDETPNDDTPAEETPSESEAPSEDTPADETPSSDTPSGETPSEADNPTGDAPADETPTYDTTAEETPSEAESPAGDTPADEPPSGDAPSEESPSEADTPSGDAPADETPSEADAPSGDAPADETPSEADTPSGDAPSEESPSEADTPSGDAPADETPSGDAPSSETPSDASSDGETQTSDAVQGETPPDSGSQDESPAATSDGESAETTNEALDETSEGGDVEDDASENADEQAEAAAAQGVGANGDGSGLEEDSVEPTSVSDNGVIVEKELNEEPEEDTSSEEADMQADEFDEEEHGETEEEIDNDDGDDDSDETGGEVEDSVGDDDVGDDSGTEVEVESSSDATQEEPPSGAEDSEPAAPEEPEEDSLSETGEEVGAGLGDGGDDTPEAASSEELTEAVSSEEAPEAVSSEEAPEAAPSEEAPEAAPSEEEPEAAPSEEEPEAAPSEEAPEAVSSEEAPEAAPSEGEPEAAPSEEAPEVAPSEEAPEAAPSEEDPEAAPSGPDASPETPLPDTENATTGVAKRRRKRVALRDPKKRWPRGIIPFSFREGTSENTKKDATAAMKFVERHSCLRFEPYNEATQKAKLGHPGHAIFENKGYCASMVGMSWRKSGQSITCTNRFVFLHEIGHLAFLVHEQQGDNRKGIVRINYDNIKDDKLKEYKSLPESMTLNSTGYSTSAVTHYAPNINSKNGEHTLTVLNKAPGMQLSGIMYYTMAEINLGYKCQEEICPNTDIKCVKDGYAVLKGDKCECECTPGIDPATGCNEPKTERVKVASWGAGKVLMPKPEKGCPDGFQDSITIESEGDQAGSSSAVHHLAGSFGSTVSLPLCVSDGSGSGEWPMGRYCFISDDGECPSDLFEKGKVTLGQKDGSDLDISFCCRDDGFPFEEVRMKNDKPFVLFQKHKKCQVIEDMYIYAEHFKLDSTKPIVKSGTLPKSGGGGGYKMSFYYCYYVPLTYGCGKAIDLTKENPEATFETPNFGKGNYPDSTMCTWIVSASEDKASILLNFEDETFCLEKGDHVDVHHNKIGQPSLRTTGKGYKPTVVTMNKLMKIQFRSDLDVSCGGFKATVKMVTKEEQTFTVEDEGASYRGTVNFTHNNIPCLPWAEVTDCPHHPFATTDGADGLDGNYCRNPGNGLQPWCYVAKDNCERNYCDVSRIGRPADNYADCDAITTADPKFCEDQAKAVRGCFKTCNVEVETPKPVTEITCKTPNAIEGASLVNEKGSYQVGEKAEYKCSSGDGGLEVVCTTTGEWTGGGYVCGDCPKGWVAFGDSCYLYQDEPLPFKEAMAVCKKFKAQIASVTSDEESELLEVLGRETGQQWLGMHKGKWLDGSSSTYENWAEGQPKKMKKKKNVVILGTLKKMQWKTVKAKKKKPLYAFTCKKQAGSRPCVDRLSNCEETLKLVPEACQNFSQNAWVVQQCRKTCGLCESKTCQVPEDMSNAVLTSPEGTVNVGEVITYECNEGYVVSEGALKLACMPSGLTNKAPSCIEKSTTTRLSNDIDIRPRAGSFSKFYSYTGSEDMYRIDADGTVIGWNFFIKYGGTVVFQIWRLVEGTEFELVGQNEVTAEHYRPHTFNVPAAEQIPVRAGDRIGIWVPSGGAGVPYDTHSASGKSGLKLATAIKNKDEFVVTQSYEFKTYSPMKIGSFQAIVGPASAWWVF